MNDNVFKKLHWIKDTPVLNMVYLTESATKWIPEVCSNKMFGRS